MVEVAESDKGLDCLHVMRGGPVFDGLKFSWIHFDRSQGDEEAKVFYLSSVKGAFREFQGKALFVKAMKDTVSSLLVESEVSRQVYKHVVHVDD